jgi:dihydrofolate reductase
VAGQAFELGLVDELRMFRYPVVVGGGTPFLPPVIEEDTAVRVISASPDREEGCRVALPLDVASLLRGTVMCLRSCPPA